MRLLVFNCNFIAIYGNRIKRIIDAFAKFAFYVDLLYN